MKKQIKEIKETTVTETYDDHEKRTYIKEIKEISEIYDKSSINNTPKELPVPVTVVSPEISKRINLDGVRARLEKRKNDSTNNKQPDIMSPKNKNASMEQTLITPGREYMSNNEINTCNSAYKHAYKVNAMTGESQINSMNVYPTETRITTNPEVFFGKLPLAYRGVLTYLLQFNKLHAKIFPTQTTIANYVGITHDHCNKVIKQLVTWGLIGKEYRHKKSCIYTISSFFYEKNVRPKLSHIFTSLKSILLLAALLSVVNNSCQTEYVNQLNRRVNKSFKEEFLSSSLSLNNIKFINYYARTRPLTVGLEGRMVMLTMEQKAHILSQVGNVKPEDVFSPVFDQVKSLNLTVAGKARLSAFPDEAIEYAEKAYQQFPKKQEIRNKYAFFMKLCWKYTNENKLYPDWSWYRNLKHLFSISDNEPLIKAENKALLSSMSTESDNSLRDRKQSLPLSGFKPMKLEGKKDFGFEEKEERVAAAPKSISSIKLHGAEALKNGATLLLPPVKSKPRDEVEAAYREWVKSGRTCDVQVDVLFRDILIKGKERAFLIELNQCGSSPEKALSIFNSESL